MSLRQTAQPGTIPAVTTETRAVTYRSVLGQREFRALLVSQGLSILGDQLARLALAVLVYRATGSDFAAAATYGVSFLAYLMGGPVLSSLADRWSRRSIMVASDLARAVLVLLLAVPNLPLAGVYALLVVLGLAAPAFDSARSATLPDMLPGEAYPRGSALFSLVHQGAQVLGFVAGGALLLVLSSRQVLLLDAVTFVLSAAALRVWVQRRPAQPATGFSLLKDTADGLRLVMGDPRLRSLLGVAVLSAAAVAAPESVAVPAAAELGGGSLASGVLTASLPAGFLLASFLVLRVAAERRERLLVPLAALSAVPLLLSPLSGSVVVTVLLWALSGAGSCVQLVASAAYVVAAPPEARGRAYGVASTSLMAVQGLAQLVVGGLSGLAGPSVAVAVIAAGMLLVLPLVRGAGRPGGLKSQPEPPEAV